MSKKEVILEVENLSKAYFSKHQPQRTIKDLISFPFVRNLDPSGRVEALTNVSFDLRRGEALGVMGPNGAGKSTLLKVLSGIVAPTSGRITINGRALSVLDIGTGFHPDLTGRENVYLNGEILGLKRKEIASVYSEVVAFSNLRSYMNLPVKHYSSGMYLRLAFSVMVNMNADLLLIDEVMAVGDASFQEKCRHKFREIIANGTSVVFVSHDPQSIINMCNRTLIIEQGRLTFAGDTSSAVEYYIRDYNNNNTEALEIGHSEEDEEASEEVSEQQLKDKPSDKSVKTEKQRKKSFDQMVIKGVAINGLDAKREKVVIDREKPVVITFRLSIEQNDNSVQVAFGFSLFDLAGYRLMQAGTWDDQSNIKLNTSGSHEVSITIPKNILNVGTYYINAYALTMEPEILWDFGKVLWFEMVDDSIDFASRKFFTPLKPELQITIDSDEQPQ